MLGVAPACLMRRDVAVRHVRERDGADCRLMSRRLLCRGARLALGQRVDAAFDRPVQVRGLLARLGQGTSRQRCPAPFPACGHPGGSGTARSGPRVSAPGDTAPAVAIAARLRRPHLHRRQSRRAAWHAFRPIVPASIPSTYKRKEANASGRQRTSDGIHTVHSARFYDVIWSWAKASEG